MYNVFIGFALLASGMTANKYLLGFISPTLFVALRMSLSGLLLILLNIYQSPRLRFHHIKFDIPTFLVIAFCTTFIPSALKAYALKNLVSSKFAFLGSLDPFITAIYAYLLFGEKLTINKILGTIIGFSGMLVLLFTTAPAEASMKAWWIFSYPELAALAAVVISRYGWLMAQKLLKDERYLPSELNGLIMMAGGFYAWLAAVFMHECTLCELPMTFKFWAVFAWTIIAGNIIAYTLYSSYLKKYSATFVSLAGLSIPFFVYLYGPFFLQENFSLSFLIAFIITVFGLFLFYKEELRKV